MRYLRSKVTVDDRALNETVLQSLESHVSQAMKASRSQTLRIVEVGAGVGAMFTRLYTRRSLFQSCESVEYTILDIKEDVLNAAAEDLMSLLQSETSLPAIKLDDNTTCSGTIRDANVNDNVSIHTAGIESDSHTSMTSMSVKGVKVNIVLCDALRYLKDNRARYDLVVAAAVLDLWEVDEAMPILEGCLDPKSPVRSFYFPINFDGVTDFFPPSAKDSAFDKEVECTFHISMGTRKTLGKTTLACHTGRRLVPGLKQYGASLKSVGSSLWSVHPASDGLYQADEKYFLSCILSFIEGTILSTDSCALPKEEFKEYLESRRMQLEDGTLYYMAHNVDVFCSFPCLT